MTSIIEGTPVPEPAYENVVFMEGISPETTALIEKIFQSEEAERLKSLTENNPWHDKENVFDHIHSVFFNYQELLSLNFVKSSALREQYQAYLDTIPDPDGTKTYRELALIACSLHDIGKGEIRPDDDELAPGQTFLITKDDGTTMGRGHEHASALAVPRMLEGSDLTQAEKDIVQYLVEHHDMYSLNFRNENFSSKEARDPAGDAEILKNHDNFSLLLVLHIVADEYGAEVVREWEEYLLSEVLPEYSLI